MQVTTTRSNRERTETTRQALLDAARRLFVESGYAETSTPDIVAAAGITRGALYHHFPDKQALFRAVISHEAAAVAAAIDAMTAPASDPIRALVDGANAYLDAMAVPGRVRLLLIDGPAVLGPAEMAALDAAHGGGTLREGLAAALDTGDNADVAIIASLLSAAFDRAALLIAQGGDRADVGREMETLVAKVVRRA